MTNLTAITKVMLLAAGIWMIGMIGELMAEAKQLEARQVKLSGGTLDISCTSDVPLSRERSAALCDALRDAVATNAHRHTFDDVTALGAHVIRATPHLMVAQLLWTQSNGTKHNSPQVTFGSQDAPLPMSRIGSFVDALLQNSDLPK